MGIRVMIVLAIGLFVLTASGYAKTEQAEWKVWEGKLNINEASEADFMQLKGIGKVTASRIVAYREKAGGFKSIMQLKEVNGVSDEGLKRLEGNLSLFGASDLRVLLDINLATESAFESLPGISKNLAREIIEHRERNEGFETVEELLLIKGITKPKFEELVRFIIVKSPPPKTKNKP